MGNEILLFGAGASVEAGVPDAKKMSREIIKTFNQKNGLGELAKVLNLVSDHLIEDARTRAADPTIDCIDVEALYNALLLLEDREALEIFPFVKSWEEKIEDIKNPKEIFSNIRFEMRRMLENLTLITQQDKVEYLQPILNLSNRQRGLFVATLNYDNAVELLSHSQQVSYDTGIKDWITTGRVNHHNHDLKLIKLHGSNYWFWTEGTATYDKRMPHHQIRFKSHFEEQLPMMVQVETIAVIFGHHNKLTADGPFLDLLKKFDEELQRANVLTVIGYSFRDPHINFYISKYLNQYEGNRIRIVDPNFEQSDVAYAKDLRHLRDLNRGQVEVIEEYTGAALKHLYV